MNSDMTGPWSAATPARLENSEGPSLRRVTIASSIGTYVEYFDLVAYGALAAVLSTVFFPASDGVASLLNTFAVFALAFAARPLGGLLWGPLGDKFGRKRTLATIIITMSVATGLVGFLPAYSEVGIWATLALVFLRFVQGISAGGEAPGAAVFIAEFSRQDRRAYQTSFLGTAVSLAQLSALTCATVLAAVLPEDELRSWGWRLPFLLAFPIGAVGLYIRSRLEETPVFTQIETVGAGSRSPLAEVLGGSQGWRAIGRAVLFGLPCTVTGFILLTFMPSYLTKNAGLSSTEALASIAVAAAVTMIMQPVGGRMSDTIGRRPMLALVASMEIVIAYPAFVLVQQGGHLLPTIGLALLGAAQGLATGSQFAPMLESFPTAQRFTGVALALGLSTAVLSGPAPYLCTWLVEVTGSLYSPAWVVIAVAVPAAIGSYFVRESYKESLSA